MKKKKIFLSKNKEVHDIEIWAILNALNNAIRKTPNISITIFCDIQETFKVIKCSFLYK